jgi:phospholipid-transporting ATPase
MEVRMNSLVLWIILVQVILCMIISIVGSFWERTEEDRILYLYFQFEVSVNGVITFFSYFLLFSTLLPISLIVTLEIVKVVQSLYIMMDYQMFSHERLKFANVSSTSIIEELGQIDYIFSDKTGTLTRNVMEFKLLHVGGTLFGNHEDLEV